MRPINLLLVLPLLAVCATAACAGLSPEQQQTATEGIDQLVAAGTLTREQGDAMIQAILGGSWSKALEITGTVVVSIVTTLLAVLGWRGPITSRKGTAPTA